MFDIATELAGWYADGAPFALATVVAVNGSAPRNAGAALAVRADGTALGSVSGGCVEGTVYELARRCLADGEPLRERFHSSDTDAFAIGLSCGGEIEVFVQRVDPAGDPALSAALAASTEDRAVALARIVAGDGTGRTLAVGPDGARTGTLGSDGLDAAVAADAAGLLSAGGAGTYTYGPDGDCDGDAVAVFVQAHADPPRMLVFGAIDFATALARLGKFLGYRVTVCDARAVFCTPRRFPDADEVVVDWPHRYLARTTTDRRTVICVLTHDAKFDVPLLVEALRRHACGYVGALGSRRTHRQRLDRLAEAGLTRAELARLRSPIGLDLGARSPEETAVSIAAEILAVRGGRAARPLSEVDGPIHARIA